MLSGNKDDVIIHKILFFIITPELKWTRPRLKERLGLGSIEGRSESNSTPRLRRFLFWTSWQR